jgi:hypothetical protein
LGHGSMMAYSPLILPRVPLIPGSLRSLNTSPTLAPDTQWEAL